VVEPAQPIDTAIDRVEKRLRGRSLRPSSNADSVGVSVNALSESSRRCRLIEGGEELSSSEVAATHPLRRSQPTRRPAATSFSSMKRAIFSMTTIASSTTSPVASVRPKSVSVLIEKPRPFINANVPISETGIVIAGISVVRQSWRKR
jgi:hypothetical protein